MNMPTGPGPAGPAHRAPRDRWLAARLQALSRDGRHPDLAELKDFLRAYKVSPRELERLIADPTATPTAGQPTGTLGSRVAVSPEPEGLPAQSVDFVAIPVEDTVATTMVGDDWDEFDDPFQLDSPKQVTTPTRGVGHEGQRSADDQVGKLVADLLDDFARTGLVERGSAVALAARRGIDARQLQQVLTELEKAGVELEEEVVPAPYDGAGDLDGGTIRRQVGSELRDQLGDYFARAGRFPLVGADVEVRLGAAIAAGRGADEVLGAPATRSTEDSARLLATSRAGRQAHADLVRANLRLVVSMAKHPRYFHSTVELPDRIQDGNIGLLRAAELFDCTLGYKFSTYATWWIRQSLERGIADRGRAIRIPVHLHEKLHRVGRARRLLEGRLGRDATVEELAEELDEDPGNVAAMLDNLRPVASLDAPIGHEDLTVGDLLSGEADIDGRQDPVEVVLAADFHRQVDQTLWSVLTEREHRVLTRRYGLDDHEPQTLDAIGAELGVTRERIRQIEKKVLVKLRANPDMAVLFEYMTASLPNAARPLANAGQALDPPTADSPIADPSADDPAARALSAGDVPVSVSSASLPR